ncbi:hypothetical protein [Sphingobium sp.]|uniref:hypothetical protein n=1 Tax=Sphingobium sp. TaxID=1912891 RepID=UPI003BB69FA9
MKSSLMVSIIITSVALGLSPSGHGRPLREAALMTEDEKYRFDQQSPTVQNAILKNLKSAKICIAAYAQKDGVKEAKIAVKSPQPRFYTAGSYGVIFRQTVPGVKDCVPTFEAVNDSLIFRRLPESISRASFLTIEWQCADAATRYAAMFNQTLAAMRPELLQAACPAGKRAGK